MPKMSQEQETANNRAEEKKNTNETNKEKENKQKETAQDTKTIKEEIEKKLKETELAQREFAEARKRGRVNEVEQQTALKSGEKVKKAVEDTFKKISEDEKEKILIPLISRRFFNKLYEAGLGTTEQSAVSIHPFLQRYLNQEINFSKGEVITTRFEQDMKRLILEDETTASYVKEVLSEMADEGLFGSEITRELIEKKFKIIEGNSDLENDWQRCSLEKGFNFNEEDRSTLKALYSPEGCVNLFNKIRTQIKQENPKLNEETISKLTSQQVEESIVLLFDKLLQEIDWRRDKQFDEVVERTQVEPMINIQFVYDRLLSALKGLRADFSENKIKNLKDYGYAFDLHQRYSEEDLYEREIKIPKRDKKGKVEKDKDGEIIWEDLPLPEMMKRTSPVPSPKTIQPKEFIEGVMTRIRTQWKIRGFLHNIAYAFEHVPAGEHGYWSQISQFADQMKAVDIDNISLLPDVEVVMQAVSLYKKYLEEDFAQNDWVNKPDAFTHNTSGRWTGTEQKVWDTLQELYPEFKEWRINRAVTMAVGLAKGVHLFEAELVAKANPPTKPKKGGEEPKGGVGSFASYYAGDSKALMAFDIRHLIERFCPAGLYLPVLFLPISEKKAAIWKSAKLWEKKEQYEAAYIQGKQALKTEKGTKLLIELFANFGRIGSFETRSYKAGSRWRDQHAYEGWLIYEKTKEGNLTQNINYFESWKAFENLGYEILLSFCDNGDIGLLQNIKGADKKLLFEYLYKNYINPDVLDDEIETELKQERERLSGVVKNEDDKPIWEESAEDIAKKIVDQKIKYGKIKKEDRNIETQKEKEREISKRLIYKSLAGTVANKMPTKFVTLESTRDSKDGQRAWIKVFENSQMTPEDFDRAMRDLGIAESLLRAETTEKMKRHLIKKTGQQTLNDIEDIDYRITQEKIEELLAGKNIDSDRINKATAVFNIINKDYCQNTAFMDEFASKIENKGFPYAIASEEVAREFLAYRNIGPTVLARLIGDTGKVETSVSQAIIKYLNSFPAVAAAKEHDPSEFVKQIAEIQKTIASIHGLGFSQEVVFNLAYATIAYFKKDSWARFIVTKPFMMGKPHSVAARCAHVGALGKVWEWDVKDIDNFILMLERSQILLREPYDPIKGPSRNREPDFKYCGKLLRKVAGADFKHKFYEILNKYGPLFVVFMFYKYITDAFKESEGKRQ